MEKYRTGGCGPASFCAEPRKAIDNYSRKHKPLILGSGGLWAASFYCKTKNNHCKSQCKTITVDFDWEWDTCSHFQLLATELGPSPL